MKELDKEQRVAETASFYTSFVQHEIFPLSREQEMTLTAMHNISNTFGEYHFLVRLLVITAL